jgi:DNA-binding SARP family transcriptional activator
MEFRVLGRLEVLSGDTAVDLGQPKQQTVLASLLIDANRFVSIDTLIDRIWGESEPDHARENIYSYITRIRRTLGAEQSGEPLIGRAEGGYRLTVNPNRVDVHQFLDAARRARTADANSPTRRRLLNSALSLWRGTPFTGLTGDWCDRVRWWLESEHTNLLADLAAAETEFGCADNAIRLLREWLIHRPVDETLAAALIRAQLAAGRQADALQTYAHSRNGIVRRLGVEPGAELRFLHERALRGTCPYKVVSRSAFPEISGQGGSP